MLKSLACSIALACCALPAVAHAGRPQGDPPPTVVIIVRHAEKQATPADDPPLTEEGKKRAGRLAGIARDAGVNLVYATQVRRTRDTAQPAAERLGLNVNVRHVTRETLDAHVRALAGEIRSSRGKTVLVVGHSNTAPRLAAALTGLTIPDLDDATEFDAIFVVVLHNGDRPKLIRAKY